MTHLIIQTHRIRARPPRGPKDAIRSAAWPQGVAEPPMARPDQPDGDPSTLSERRTPSRVPPTRSDGL